MERKVNLAEIINHKRLAIRVKFTENGARDFSQCSMQEIWRLRAESSTLIEQLVSDMRVLTLPSNLTIQVDEGDE